MRLLLFSDVHRDKNAAEQLVQNSKDADVVVGAGDFASVHKGLDEMIEILSKIPCPTILVPGNNETFEELQAACANWDSAHILHGTGITILDTPFYGLGGGVPVTPFGSWSYDFTEEEAENLLQNAPAQCVLVTHSPPKEAVDVSSGGKHLGSATIRKFIDQKKPALVVCGHIHESNGKHETIGNSHVVNAGPQGMFWEI